MDKITLERSIWINAPRERVWQAVSEPTQIAAWFAPGMVFEMRDNKVAIEMDGQFVEVAEIKVFDPPRELTTRGLPDGVTATTYLLVDENGGTRFTVIETGLEQLPAEARQQHLEQNGAAWEQALGNLNAYINGMPLPRPEGF
jgi:uncharacterized protein YndB with AHSA1/START domain